MLPLIDADIVLHRVCWTTEQEDFGIARFRADDMLDGIITATRADAFQLWLSDSKENNFRYAIYPPYKATRTQPRPRHYEALKEYLIVQWGARIAHGMEADDALGIHQDKVGAQTIIASIDKDLLTIPGHHWNFVKQEHIVVSPVRALQNFYAQFLIGDTADNIKGCEGIGPKKAAKLIDPLETEEEMFEAVVEAYQQKNPDKSNEELLTHILIIGRVLKIKQSEGETLWNFPSVKFVDFLNTRMISTSIDQTSEENEYAKLVT